MLEGALVEQNRRWPRIDMRKEYELLVSAGVHGICTRTHDTGEFSMQDIDPAEYTVLHCVQTMNSTINPSLDLPRSTSDRARPFAATYTPTHLPTPVHTIPREQFVSFLRTSMHDLRRLYSTTRVYAGMWPTQHSLRLTRFQRSRTPLLGRGCVRRATTPRSSVSTSRG